jgi:hypothetical protein
VNATPLVTVWRSLRKPGRRQYGRLLLVRCDSPVRVHPGQLLSTSCKSSGAAWFTIRYAVSGTTYGGLFSSAVRAVDQAGNRSVPTPSTFVW